MKVKGIEIHRWAVGIGVTLALAGVVPLAVVACGGAERPTTEAGEEVRERVQPPDITLPPPPPEAETVLASGDTSYEAEPVGAPEPTVEVTYEVAESSFLAGRYAEAERLFTAYSERRPENPWGYYMLGLSAWKAGELERAEEALLTALELDPEHVKSRVNLGRVLLDGGQPHDALLNIEEVLAIDPESNAGLRLLGRANHQLGQVEQAIDAYRRAILVDDTDAWSMNNMGLVLIEQERFGEALPPLARAVELRDDVAIFQNNLGVALERAGHFRCAEETYRSALAIDSSYENAKLNLARVERLEQPADLQPVDLGELARAFIDEVEGWREALAYKDGGY
ncbi:MAG: tetratricopeptide repeat protein [Gemmatimonadales bacterium]|jgi:tetratricopeptide (TPR) repeat protein